MERELGEASINALFPSICSLLWALDKAYRQALPQNYLLWPESGPCRNWGICMSLAVWSGLQFPGASVLCTLTMFA